MSDVSQEKPKRTRKPAAKKAAASNGNKTLAAAIAAALLAGLDLYLQFRHGVKWPF